MSVCSCAFSDLICEHISYHKYYTGTHLAVFGCGYRQQFLATTRLKKTRRMRHIRVLVHWHPYLKSMDNQKRYSRMICPVVSFRPHHKICTLSRMSAALVYKSNDKITEHIRRYRKRDITWTGKMKDKPLCCHIIYKISRLLSLIYHSNAFNTILFC